MARMVPFPMLPTKSSAERRLYEGFLVQLDDAYVVYHSVDWVLAPSRRGGPPVQGECDFLIAHPIDGLLVLEAKGGSLEYESDTRTWFQTGRAGRHALPDDPFHQARDQMHSLVEILSAQPRWATWRPSFGYGVAFPDGAYDRQAHPGAPVDIALDRHDLQDLAGRVKAIMRHWRRQGRRFGGEGMEALERALGFRVEIRLPLQLQFEEDDRRIVELTGDQVYVLAYITKRRRAAVVGPAGSGKTMLAVELARRLAGKGHRSLLTCFNRRLGEYLRETVGGTPGLDVFHFHDLCVRMAAEAGLPIPQAPDAARDGSPYFEVTLPELLAQAARRLGPRYSALVVDEAQDFRPGWWPSLMSLHVDPAEGHLYVFTDDNQNLYGGSAPEDLVDQTVPLHTNIRNTRSIHEFVSVFHRGEARPRAAGPPGRGVEILGYRDDEELARLLALVLQNLQAEGVPLEDIVVLTPARPSKSALRRRGRVNGYAFADMPREGTVLATTVHGFKGLERPVVILAELGERHEEDLDTYLYVGGSRARSHLIILAAEPVAHRLRTLAGVTK